MSYILPSNLNEKPTVEFINKVKFLGLIVNCGERQEYRISTLPINRYLHTNRLYFGQKVIEIKSPYGTKYAGIASIKEYRPSTNAGILDGDIVIVERCNIARNGEIVVAMTDENEVTLKRFYKEKNHIRLQPENDSLDPIILNNVTILGKAIGLYRKI